MLALVCGGCAVTDRAYVFARLDAFRAALGIDAIIHGAARGADRIAGEWAVARGIPVRAFPADWDRHRKSAWPIRNRRMLDERPDCVIAFMGGKGTADCIRQATARLVRVYPHD